MYGPFEDEVVLDGVRGEVRVADGEGEGGRRRLSPGSAPLPPLVRRRVVVGLAAAAAAHDEGLRASNIVSYLVSNKKPNNGPII